MFHSEKEEQSGAAVTVVVTVVVAVVAAVVAVAATALAKLVAELASRVGLMGPCSASGNVHCDLGGYPVGRGIRHIGFVLIVFLGGFGKSRKSLRLLESVDCLSS